MRIVSTLGFAFLVALTACGGGGTSTSDNLTKQNTGVVSGPAVPTVDPTVTEGVGVDSPETSIIRSVSDSIRTLDTAEPPTARKRQGSFSSSEPGWISNDAFWQNYRVAFNIGAGSSTVAPSTGIEGTLPPSAPIPSNVGGLSAYLLPAAKKQIPPPDINPRDVWDGPPLTPQWNDFLQNSMACYPACGMVIADILASAPPATAPSIGLRRPPLYAGELSLGSPALDAIIHNPHHPAFQDWYSSFNNGLGTLAKAIDRKDERLMAAMVQLARLVDKAKDSPGPTEFQYALLADRDGVYPDVRFGTVKLKKLDVWKYGTSFDPDGRYSPGYLSSLGLSMVVQFEGTKEQTLEQEKSKLILYYKLYRELPPGNKIFK